MKKLLSILFAAATLTASAATWTPEYFINGNAIQITNNTTLVYTQQNVFFQYKDASYKWAFATSNQPVTVVNGVSYWTNTVVVNTNITNPQAWVDVTINGDVNGNAMQPNISITAALDTAVATNKYTFIFARVPDGVNVDTVNGNGVNLITGAFAITGVTNTTWTTNLLTTFTQGGGKIRLVSITTANSTTNALGSIKNISLNGFVP